MGRHGGGSRSGGSSRSGGGSRSSGGGSRGGGASARTSAKPFVGSYNRSYYDRHGRLHTCYTSNRNFGAKSGWSLGKILILVFITIHMCMMVGGLLTSAVERGEKINGDRARIFIEDRADLLTDAEEQKVLKLFDEVYVHSGMPVTLYTEDFAWKDDYQSLEVYSEELYYQLGFEEDAMVILFTAGQTDGFDDWEYDIYCGDDTTKCFSDPEFDTLLSSFQKGMANQNLAEALDYAWNSVMDDIGKTEFDTTMIPVLFFLLVFYGIFYAATLAGTAKANRAYRYFKANPDKLSMTKITTIYSTCPNCGAANVTGDANCQYCGSLLRMREGDTRYVNPDDTGAPRP